MIRAAQELYKDAVQGEVLRILDPDDELLLETVHLFEKVRTSSQNRTLLACFFELRPCNVRAVLGQEREKSFAVSESSGCLDAAQKIGLQRTHFDMNKFGKPNEEEYQTVRNVIEEMVEAAPRQLLARLQYSGEHRVAFSLKGVPLANRFVGRDAEMQRLENYFHPKTSSPTRRKVFVVHGLGGIGKTQLAVEFARKHHSRYSAVFWLDGSSKDRLKQSFVDIAYRLPRDQVTADAAEALKHSNIDFDVVVGGVLRWLSLPSNQHWLLIIDNVDRDHLNKEKDPQTYDVKESFPPADHGSILITSRLAGLERHGDGLKVDKVDDEQAKVILENNARKSIKDVDLIIKRLNGLPLALTQAGSYLRHNIMSASDYAKHYDSTWEDLMKEQDRFPLQEYADRSVLTTWTISYEQVQSQSEEAANLLKLWGFLDCGDLWYELTPGWLLQLAGSDLKFLGALQLLSHYSLVNAREETSSHAMHSVLHKWCCQLSQGSERKMLSWLAAGLVARTVPEESEPEYWKLRRRILPHGNRVYRAVDDERLEQSHGASDLALPPWIFYSLGLLFAHQDKLNEAEKMYQRALAGYEKALSVEHTSTLDTVNNLGLLYADQGKLGEAEEMYQRALKGKEKTLGLEHASTLNTVNNLGNLYADQGKLGEAEEMYQRALVGYKKALSVEHTSTLNTVNNLGLLYADQGKLGEAEEMYQWALAGYKKALGPEHTSTLSTINNLGNLYADQGKLSEAEEMYQQALKGKEKALGLEHSSTLNTVNNLGNLYADQGKLGEAEKMYQQVLAGYEKALGPEHTSTLDIVNNLGLLYVDQGKLGEAEEMYQQALALGLEHTSTLDIVNNLGNLYRGQGKLGEAEEMYQRALAGYEKALGPEHTSTLSTVNNLGNLYVDQGKLGEAEEMYQRALEGKEKALGPEHTSTLNTVINLGLRYVDQGY
ncbi:hypothetical protein W97_04984 [Coniosporium apollinis CBS 100218]|uniref:Orc1-like AAA ATPase domain-containing protein n=1 Tax=Coniosporium apollinis (strain CBS 100218) TaxID=1168221 RepID=R7YUY9_CONA1|nr:uncharacterized protein W97_04984 [Coniosporium apollinis CBS 100218]EON65745.1 hypothetical protein W97_04984 [Coniosporium apollinis CBS 100218]